MPKRAMQTIEEVLEDVARSYPSRVIDDQRGDIPRIAFNIRLALNGADPGGMSICDIGGGIGLFSVGCAALGMNALLVDDFADPVNRRVGDSVFVVHKKYGVRILSRNVISDGLADISERFDVVTTFDSMEHWHNSPKILFRQVANKLLKPGGRFVLSVPNCVNVRKRLSVPLGIGKWSTMQEWYEEPEFRGHVREPDVADLRYLALDMGLEDVQILGRNWLGYGSRSRLVKLGTRIADRPLQMFPSLCADLYMIGHSPPANSEANV
jgi:2-polyprenyl-3-methyl-5-hydroxy-6-metoxy-1,4-benzoquinol methylase